VSDHRRPAAEDASVWNIANALTVARLLVVPLLAWLLLYDEGDRVGARIAAFCVFAAAAATDRMDGELARRRGLVTNFGKIADPIADKALLGTALVGLSALGELAWWITVTILIREIGVTLLRFWVIRHGVIPASRGGKWKTVLQTLAVGLYILPLEGWLATGRAWVMAVAVIVTVVTGADYVLRALRLRQAGGSATANGDGPGRTGSG
jgi:CDP-diacylglycerol---glycerol-3-phosphate 3-phosphatidyltransferase